MIPLFYIKKTRAAEFYTLLSRVPKWCIRRGSNPNRQRRRLKWYPIPPRVHDNVIIA